MSRLTVERSDAVAIVTIGDGLRRNALGETDWNELAAEIDRLGDDPTTRVIVLTGRDRMFSAGSDLTEWVEADANGVERCFHAMESCFRRIETVTVPVVAAVEGAATGAGCQLALACDLAVLASSARIGMPVVRLGIHASPAFVERLSARIGASLTSDLYLTGRLLTADEARDAGLVARVTPPGDSLAEACLVADGIRQLPARAVAAAKAVTRAVSGPRTAWDRTVPTVDATPFHDAICAFLDGPRATASAGVHRPPGEPGLLDDGVEQV